MCSRLLTFCSIEYAVLDAVLARKDADVLAAAT